MFSIRLFNVNRNVYCWFRLKFRLVIINCVSEEKYFSTFENVKTYVFYIRENMWKFVEYIRENRIGSHRSSMFQWWPSITRRRGKIELLNVNRFSRISRHKIVRVIREPSLFLVYSCWYIFYQTNSRLAVNYYYNY